MISRLLLTARTVVRLRPRQVAARVLRSVRGPVGAPGLRPPPRAVRLRPEILALAAPLAERLATDAFTSVRERAERLRDGTFQAVGESVPVDGIRWTGRRGSHLFRYHLHYFDDAPALAALARRGDVSAETRLLGLWEDWLEACETGGGDGWDPYPISSRIPNWIQALALLDEREDHPMPEGGGRGDTQVRSHPGVASGTSPELRHRIVASLWTQADRLRRTLEHDLAGNHLLRNRAALVWAAAALDPAPLGLAEGIEPLVREVERQVLADGMHEERTPAYHGKVLGDVLDVLELLGALHEAAPPELEEHARRMRSVLRLFVRRGDGGLHPFGDTTPHGEPRAAALEHRARHLLGPARSEPAMDGPWHLTQAGFAGFRGGDLEIVLDCGPFGARHQPAHGHCDGLSFVLSVRGTPLLVDPGIAGYADDPWRTWARGTAAHNTVQVDELEQTEIWATFRAARRARPRGAGVKEEGGEVRLSGALSPYHAPRIRHERELVVQRGGARLEVRDVVRGAGGRRLDTRLHFAPGTMVRPEGEECWAVRTGEEVAHLEVRGLDEVRWDTGKVFPGWGTVEEGPVLHARIDSAPDPAAFGFLLRLSGA